MRSPVLSINLWQRLWRDVPLHPLLTATFVGLPDPRREPIPAWAGILGTLMFLPFIWVFGFGFALVALFVGGVLVGAVAAALLGAALHREEFRRRADLWAIMPCGALGVGWVIAFRVMRMDRTLRQVSEFTIGSQRIMFGLVALIGVLLGLFATLFDPRQSWLRASSQAVGVINAPLVQGLILLAIIGLWLASDSVQSPQMGLLAGLIAPQVGRSAFGTALFAAVSSVLTQIVVFALSGAITAALILLMQRSGMIFNLVGLLGVLVVVITILREIVMQIGWRAICRALNANDADLDAINLLPPLGRKSRP